MSALQGKGEDDVEKAARLFADIQQQIDSKQLKPFIRTQYMRSAFQVGRGLRERASSNNLTPILKLPDTTTTHDALKSPHIMTMNPAACRGAHFLLSGARPPRELHVAHPAP